MPFFYFVYTDLLYRKAFFGYHNKAGQIKAESRSASSAMMRLWTTRNSYPRYFSVPAYVGSPFFYKYHVPNETKD